MRKKTRRRKRKIHVKRFIWVILVLIIIGILVFLGAKNISKFVQQEDTGSTRK